MGMSSAPAVRPQLSDSRIVGKVINRLWGDADFTQAEDAKGDNLQVSLRSRASAREEANFGFHLVRGRLQDIQGKRIISCRNGGVGATSRHSPMLPFPRRFAAGGAGCAPVHHPPPLPTHSPVAWRARAPVLRSLGEGGFTLIELLAVITVVAILAGFTFGLIRGVQERTAIARTKSELAVLTQALGAYRRHYGDYPQAADAGEFYQSLTGCRGPHRNVLDPPGRTFIETSRFTLRDADPLAAGNVLLDPWGRPYRYLCFPRTGNGATSHGCVLFSCGPDGLTKPDDPPASGAAAGEPDLTHPDNADNLYANR